MCMGLEQELRHALRRTDPPTGFDRKVLSQLGSGGTRVRLPVAGRRWRRAALPIAASVMLALGGAYFMHQQSRGRDAEAHTEQAARDVVLALEITSEKIAAAQERLRR